jgi:hypothetical protein
MSNAGTGRYTPVTLLALAIMYFSGALDGGKGYTVTGLAVVLAAMLWSVAGRSTATGQGTPHLAGYIPTALVVASLSVVVFQDKTPWYSAFDDTALVLLVCGVIGYVVAEASHTKAGEVAYAVRDMMYVMAAAGVAISLAVHMHALTSLYDDPAAQGSFNNSTSFLRWTTAVNTSHNCSDTSTSGGIILGGALDYTKCPRELWKQIRLDFLLTTQVFMLYTLTTRMRHEQMQDHNALLIATAVIECIAFTAAAVVQFDNIDEVYTLHRSAMWLTLLGGMLSLAPVGIKWHTTTSHSPRRAPTLVYHAVHPNNRHPRSKLKL